MIDVSEHVHGDHWLLGHGTSRQENHNHDGPSVGRCSACRWTEVHIFGTDTGEFLAVTVGATSVEGETNRIRVEKTSSPSWLVESLHRDGRLSYPAKRALLHAADNDFEIRSPVYAAVWGE